jgi:hypothetical protein
MKIHAACLFVCLVAAPVAAQTTPPKPSPPSAAEFTALTNQVATLTTQVTALTASVAKLESGAVTPADLVGTYHVHALGIEMHGNPARVSNEVADVTILLRGDGTGHIAWTDSHATLHQGAPWFVTRSVDPTITGEFTWTLTNGFFVIDNSDFGAEVGAGGRLLFWGGQSVGGGDDGSWSNLAIGVKLPPQ